MIQDILAEQFARYPRMEPQDAVKLLYQAEFGPGHLIRDEKKCLDMIREEMAQCGETAPGERMYEPVGGGLCRWNLRPCRDRGIPPEDICRLLTETAQSVRGDKRRFLGSLKMLEEMAEGDETPFEAIFLDIFLIQYRDKNCPPLHHSEAYRRAYRPAYRIVNQRALKEYLARRRERA